MTGLCHRRFRPWAALGMLIPGIVASLGLLLPARADPAGDVASALDRPLFSPSRKPVPSAEVSSVPVGDVPRLSGILFGPDFRRAIFESEGGKPLSLAEGDQVGAYTIHQIEATRVILSGPSGLQAAVLQGSSGPGGSDPADGMRPPLPTQMPANPFPMAPP